MTNRNNSINVPEARDAMDKFKMQAASEMGVTVLDKLPLDPKITSLIDAGDIEKVPADYLNGTVKMVEDMIEA